MTNKRVENISVMMCAYNAEKYISESIESVLLQTYQRFELLVVDDASTDKTLDIAHEYAQKDYRIRVISKERNQGLAMARKVALKNARYDWGINIDADDVFLPTALEEFAKEINADPDLILVSSYAYYVDEDVQRRIGTQMIGPTSKKQFFDCFRSGKLMFFPSTSLFSKKHALKVGGTRIEGFDNTEKSQSKDYAEDLDLWSRMADLGTEGYYMRIVPKPLFLYRKHRGSMAAKNISLMNNKIRWIKACMVARRTGKSEPTFADFLHDMSLVERLNNKREDFAGILYKKATFGYISGNLVTMILFLLAAAILAPKLVYEKVNSREIRV